MADIFPALKKTLKFEGNYSNDSDDPGGETKYGITIKVARDNGYDGEMKLLSLQFAAKIYRGKYWDRVQGDGIIVQGIAESIFDFSVNCGVVQAVRIVQDVLNKYIEAPILEVDGILGNVTLKTINLFTSDEKKNEILREIRRRRKAFYRHLITKNPVMKKYENGWMRRAENF